MSSTTIVKYINFGKKSKEVLLLDDFYVFTLPEESSWKKTWLELMQFFLQNWSILIDSNFNDFEFLIKRIELDWN